MCGKELESHVKKGSHSAAADHVGTVQIEEYLACEQQLAAVPLPHFAELL